MSDIDRDAREAFIPRRLGEALFDSPVKLSRHVGDYQSNYVQDDERILYQIELSARHPITHSEVSPSWKKPAQGRKSSSILRRFTQPSSLAAAFVQVSTTSFARL
jgi:hypothetical protein